MYPALHGLCVVALTASFPLSPQALRVLHRLVGQLLLGGQADPPLSSKQIYSQVSQG